MNLMIDAITFSTTAGITPPVFPMHVPDASGLVPLALPDALARRLASSESDAKSAAPQTHPAPESVLRFQSVMATPVVGVPRRVIEASAAIAIKDQPPQHQPQPPVASTPIYHAEPVIPDEFSVKAEPSVNIVHHKTKTLPENSIGTTRQVEIPVQAASPAPVTDGTAAPASKATVTEVVTEVPVKPTLAAEAPAKPDSPAPVAAETPTRPDIPAPVVAETPAKPATPAPVVTEVPTRPATPVPVAERPAAPANPAPVAATVAEAPAKPDIPAPVVAEAPTKPRNPAPVAEAPTAPASPAPAAATVAEAPAKPNIPAPVVAEAPAKPAAPAPVAEKAARPQVVGLDEEDPAQPLQAADLSAVRTAAVPQAADAPAAMSAAATIDPSAATARTNELVEAAVAVAETISATPSLVRGDGEVVIRLKPTVLDGSEIRLEAKGSSVSISVLPSNEAVAQAVVRSQAQFAQQLSERMPSFQFAVTVAAVAAGSRKDKANEPA